MTTYFDYIKALQKLPEPVQDFFSTDYLSNQVEQIAKAHDISTEIVNDILSDLVAMGLEYKNLEFLVGNSFDKTKAAEVLVDLLGRVFFPIDQDLNWDIQKIFNDKGINVDPYLQYLETYHFSLETDKIEAFLDALDEKIKSLDINEVSRELLETYSSFLTAQLKETDPELVRNFNLKTFLLIDKVKDFSDQAAKAVVSNQEKLSNSEFILNGKRVVPTISNWFKDFFRLQGSGYFDALALSKYMSESANVRKLTSGEREMVRKMFLTYRNLAFYKKVFENVTAENWQIIPIETNDEETDPLMELNKPQRAFSASEEVSKPKPLIVAPPVFNSAKEQENSSLNTEGQNPLEKDNQLSQLKALLESYPEGSLERKMVEEEIKKIEQSS